jgi:hypothetical protein
VGSTFAGVGVQLRKPLAQRRAVRRVLEVKFRRPISIVPLNGVARFWHPPLANVGPSALGR